ncbi:unnamed protein product [Didymodactylos carnosus]|uniref:Glutathione S-transferase C-terminal domain-containing protein n=1 Tax=Didymodactylos carnosus TaxID=1234261 RepID=A0A813SQ61_9BILA|nr:unnamed protein product [Didymodactylos carnosus]CAF0835871.1 unnamed protein product [Didymodactylos carnosus]CAF3589175.1 unnamed protein product [Didymodactylos carnosus]CAF3620782.1 unnamed protein product [Didymodactylos carnosus]
MLLAPSEQSILVGEISILRYLSRLFSWGYDGSNLNEIQVALTDQFLSSNNGQFQFDQPKSKWLIGDQMTLADLVLWAQLKQQQNLSASISGSAWFKGMNDLRYCQAASSLVN